MWRSGSRAHELKATRFDYKQLEGSECKALRIKQIRSGRQKYRVALVIEETDEPKVVFLSACLKAKQDDGIRAAIRRARARHENEENDASESFN